MREKCPRCNQPFECMGSNIVCDLTRKILSDRRRNSVLPMQKLLVQGRYGTREFSKSGDHSGIFGNKWTLVHIISVKNRDLQGRNKHSQIIEPASVNGLQEIHNVLLLFLYILFTIN